MGHPAIDVPSANLASVMGLAGRTSAQKDGHSRLTRPWLGDSGPMLDSQAKAEYGRRLSELAGDLEDARKMNDLAAYQRLAEEMDFIAGEISRAVGLGGRDRRSSSTSERARLSVTKL